MTFSYPYGETVRLCSRTVNGTDAHGNDTYTETSTDIPGVPVWPRGSSEMVQGQDTTVVGLWALLPPGTDVMFVDRVIVRGQAYEVDGEPAVQSSPLTGTNAGVQVALKRVTG